MLLFMCFLCKRKTYTQTSNVDTVTTTYPNGAKIICAYDKYGNPLSVVTNESDKKILTYVYGSITEDVTAVDENGESVTERGSEDRSEVLRKKCHQNVDNPYEEVYNYDQLKRLKSIARTDNVEISYWYDQKSRLESESVHADYRFIDYGYEYEISDALTPDRISMIRISIDHVDINSHILWDDFGLLMSQDTELFVDSGWNNYISYTCQYEESTADGKNYTNRRITNFACDIQRSNVNLEVEEAYGDSEALTYDSNGNVQTISNYGIVNHYSYDDRNRLVEEVDTQLVDTQWNERYVYAYNDGGNIVSKTIYDTTTGIQKGSYSYNYTNDRLTSYKYEQTYSIRSYNIDYDDYGNPIKYKGKELTWVRGRLLAKYGSVCFGYDGNGFRRTKATGSNTITYSYQNGKLLCERHSRNAENNLYFVYHGDEIVGFVKGTTETYYYFQKDVLGNVVAVYDANNGQVAAYTYDAWGKCRIRINVNGIATLNPIRYRGYYYDEETGLYYLQTRYYDPEIGRFISPDTVDYLDPETVHGLNLYAYCNNNPIMYTDPTGHMPNWLKWVIGGVAFAGAVALTALSGGALAPMFIQMGASIAVGGLIEGAANAIPGESFWEGFADGTADGAMWGGISALASSTVSCVKNLSLIKSRGVVIGKGMERVGFIADQAALSKYTPMKGYDLIRGSGESVWRASLADKMSVAHNKAWINRVMRLKKPIYDIGLGKAVEAGAWYGMELQQVTNYFNYFLF